MGIISRIKGIFRKKEALPVPAEMLKPVTLETAGIEGVKAKVELALTQLESLRVQNETLNERIKNIERLVTEIRSYCK